MLIDDLIEKLHDLKREYGNLEVILYTQKDAWFWDDHTVEDVYYAEDDNAILIQGEDKTGGSNNEN
jgi:hypothetical protein